MTSQKHIRQYGDPRKELNILIGPSNPFLRDLMGVMTCNLFTVEKDLSFLWMVITCNTVHEACLSSTIRPDDADQFPRVNGEIHIMECHHTPEIQKHFFHLQLSPVIRRLSGGVDTGLTSQCLHRFS